MPDTDFNRAIQTALAVVGDRAKLAERLGVSAAELEGWLEGSKQPPIEIFHRAVDILTGGPKSGPTAPEKNKR